MSRQGMREQSDDREQPKQGRSRASNGQIRPLPLRFDPEMRADFVKRHFHLPALHEPGHYLCRGQRQICTQQCLRAEFILRVPNQHPADGDECTKESGR